MGLVWRGIGEKTSSDCCRHRPFPYLKNTVRCLLSSKSGISQIIPLRLFFRELKMGDLIDISICSDCIEDWENI
jgi:hypothetical protein